MLRIGQHKVDLPVLDGRFHVFGRQIEDAEVELGDGMMQVIFHRLPFMIDEWKRFEGEDTDMESFCLVLWPAAAVALRTA